MIPQAVEELKLLRAEAEAMREQINQLNQHNQLLLNDNTQEHMLRQEERRRSISMASEISPCKCCLHLAAQLGMYSRCAETLLKDVWELRSLIQVRSPSSLSPLDSSLNKFSVLGEK